MAGCFFVVVVVGFGSYYKLGDQWSLWNHSCRQKSHALWKKQSPLTVWLRNRAGGRRELQKMIRKYWVCLSVFPGPIKEGRKCFHKHPQWMLSVWKHILSSCFPLQDWKYKLAHTVFHESSLHICSEFAESDSVSTALLLKLKRRRVGCEQYLWDRAHYFLGRGFESRVLPFLIFTLPPLLN